MKRFLISLLVILIAFIILFFGYSFWSYHATKAQATPPYVCDGLRLVSAQHTTDDDKRYYNFTGICRVKIPQDNSWVYQNVCVNIAAAWERSSNTAVETIQIPTNANAKVNLQLQCQDDPWVSDARCAIVQVTNNTQYPAFSKQFIFYNREYPPVARDGALNNQQTNSATASCNVAATTATPAATSLPGAYPVPQHYARTRPPGGSAPYSETTIIYQPAPPVWWQPCPWWNPWCSAPTPVPPCPWWNPYCNPWVPPAPCPWWNPACNPWVPPNPCSWWNPGCNPWVPSCPWWKPWCHPVPPNCPTWNPNCTNPLPPVQCPWWHPHCFMQPKPLVTQPMKPLIDPLHPVGPLRPIRPLPVFNPPLKPIIRPPVVKPIQPPVVRPITPPVRPVVQPIVKPVPQLKPVVSPRKPIQPLKPVTQPKPLQTKEKKRVLEHRASPKTAPRKESHRAPAVEERSRQRLNLQDTQDNSDQSDNLGG